MPICPNIYKRFQTDYLQTNLPPEFILFEPHRFLKLSPSLTTGNFHTKPQLILEKQTLWQQRAPMRGGMALLVHCSPHYSLLLPDVEGVRLVLFVITPLFLISLQDRNFFIPISQPELGKQKINREDRVFLKQIGEHTHSLVFCYLLSLYRHLSLQHLSCTNTTDSREAPPFTKEICFKE